MTQSCYTLKGVLSTFPNYCGRIYDEKVIEKAMGDFLNKQKQKNRENKIDYLLGNTSSYQSQGTFPFSSRATGKVDSCGNVTIYHQPYQGVSMISTCVTISSTSSKG